MAGAAREVLWQWVAEIDDPDPEQLGWKRARIEGILLACERIGLLAADELMRWRAVIDGRAPAGPARTDPEAATAFLASVLRDVRPMTRDEDPERIRASTRFHGALSALADAGVITDEEQTRWHEQELSASAPWLSSDNVEQLASTSGIYAIGIPARTPEEEAADEAARDEHERLGRRGALRRVVTTPTPERHDGLAVIGVLACEECTEVLFHFVGPPHGDRDGGFADLDAHRELVDALVPPRLSDDVGTVYEPAGERPVRSTGTGGMPDPERRRVITGAWRYFPAAPPTASEFVAALGATRWTVVHRDES